MNRKPLNMGIAGVEPRQHPNPKGVFSVRSAYKLRLKLQDVAAGETSSSTAANPTTGASSKWQMI
jgi:hypothetical protein